MKRNKRHWLQHGSKQVKLANVLLRMHLFKILREHLTSCNSMKVSKNTFSEINQCQSSVAIKYIKKLFH